MRLDLPVPQSPRSATDSGGGARKTKEALMYRRIGAAFAVALSLSACSQTQIATFNAKIYGFRRPTSPGAYREAGSR